VTSGRFPRHAGRPGAVRQAGRIAEPAPVRVLADGDHDAGQPEVRFDPLIHPVAITGHCVIGDQIRVPAACCAMAGCQAAFVDPAALGEADNRARAAAAGWARDALGRLMCPACQRDHPVPAWWVASGKPALGDHRPAGGTARPAGGTNQSIPPAVWGPPAAAPGRPHRRPWPRLLSALAGSGDGWTARAGSRIPDAGTMPGPRCRTCWTPRPDTPDSSDYRRLNRSWHGRGSPARRRRSRSASPALRKEPAAVCAAAGVAGPAIRRSEPAIGNSAA
jgi:hypothetical protein